MTYVIGSIIYTLIAAWAYSMCVVSKEADERAREQWLSK